MGWVWIVLVLAHLVYAVWFSPRIIHSEDEMMYTTLAKGLVERGSLYFENGYTENPARIFLFHQFLFPTRDGAHISAMYPPFYPIAAAPFFWMFGTEGMYHFNTLLFLASVWLTFRIVQRVLGRADVAHSAALIYALANFAWPLSLLPLSHLICVVLIQASFLFAWSAAFERIDDRDRLVNAANAGLLLGFAVISRIDSLFALAGIAGLFAYARPMRLGAMLVCLAALAVPVAELAWFNDIRFGTLSPFSYSGYSNVVTEVSRYVAPSCMLALLLGWGWLWQRTPLATHPTWRWPFFGAIAISLGVCASYFPEKLWQNIALIGWAQKNIVNVHELYDRSLLENAPYLAALPLAFFFAACARQLRQILLLSIIPLAFALIYMVNGFPSGLHFYQRYFFPAMPFLCALIAYSLLKLWRPQVKWLAAIAAAAFSAAFFAEWLHAQGQHELNMAMLLLAPKIMAALLAAMAVVLIIGNRFLWYSFQGVFGIFLLFSVCWSAAVVFVVDHRYAWRIKPMFDAAYALSEKMPDNTFFLTTTDGIRFLGRLLDVPGLRFGLTVAHLNDVADLEEELPRLTKYYRAHNIPVYSAFSFPTNAPDILVDIGYRPVRLPGVHIVREWVYQPDTPYQPVKQADFGWNDWTEMD